MNNKLSISVVIAAAIAGTSIGAALAGDHATAAEAQAMLKKGIALIKANGKEKGYAEISNKQGKFVDRDLYPT